MADFGSDAWLRAGEAFSIYFGILARFAPTVVRVKSPQACRECCACEVAKEGRVNCYECFAMAPAQDRELEATRYRPRSSGAGGSEQHLLRHPHARRRRLRRGLLATPLQLEIVRLTPLTQTLELFPMPLLFLGVYLDVAKLSQLSGGGSVRLGRLASGYVYSLGPIAIAYQVAHYYTYLLIQLQGIISQLSDRFGWGWNLFGTVDYEVRIGIVDAAFVWYSQVVLIERPYTYRFSPLRVTAGRARALSSGRATP